MEFYSEYLILHWYLVMYSLCSSGSLSIWSFQLKFLIHLECRFFLSLFLSLFWRVIHMALILSFYMWASSFSITICGSSCLFSSVNFGQLSDGYNYMHFNLGLLFLSTDPHVWFCAITIVLPYNLKYGIIVNTALFFLLRIVLAIFGLLYKF